VTVLKPAVENRNNRMKELAENKHLRRFAFVYMFEGLSE